MQAYALLPKKLQSQHPLILVGSMGWLCDALHLQIQVLSSLGWVKHIGFVAEDDLPMLYAGARLFVYPSIYEGFGLPVIEAMASGVPVITSDRTSLPEISQGAALLIDPDNIDRLKDAISLGLQDEGWRASAIVKGLLVAKQYTWENCAAQTLHVYEHVQKNR